jgi:hypothetical protein
MLPCLDYPDCPLFKRGDANGGGCVNADDATYINDFLFLAGPAPPCMLAANAADDDQILIGDSVYILAYCTTGGPAPPAPGAFVCGDDPTPGVLTAATLRAARVARISFPAIAIRTGIWISAMPCTSSGLFSTRPPRRFPAVTEARTTLPTAGS